MDAVDLIERMMTHPSPVEFFNIYRRREMLKPVQKVDNPLVIVSRPYGMRRGLGAVHPPTDYTMRRFGGTMRGREIARWQDNQVLSHHGGDRDVNAPNIVSYRTSSTIRKHGEMWLPPSQR